MTHLSTDEEDRLECDFCRYPSKNIEFYDSRGKSGYLCFVCASTDAGIAFHYPEQYDSQILKIMTQISFTANMILDSIEKNR